MTSLSYSKSKVSDMLLHQAVEAGYLAGPVGFASDWVWDELINRYLEVKKIEAHDFLAASGGKPNIAALRGALRERHTNAALQRLGGVQAQASAKARSCPL